MDKTLSVNNTLYNTNKKSRLIVFLLKQEKKRKKRKRHSSFLTGNDRTKEKVIFFLINFLYTILHIENVLSLFYFFFLKKNS